MPCCITCPICHTKFYKVSYMATQNLRKEHLVRSVGVLSETSSQGDQPTTQSGKLQIEKDNEALRAKIADLTLENETLRKALNENREKYEEGFKKLQNDIKANESQLLESSKRCLELQKKLCIEIKNLKHENEELENEKHHNEAKLKGKLESLENELKLVRLDNQKLKSNRALNDEKLSKYKRKLKETLTVISNLSQAMAQYECKPEITYQNTGTEAKKTVDRIFKHNAESGDSIQPKSEINCEDLLLSDIFFKHKSFVGSEIDLFRVRSNSLNLLK